MFDPEWDAQDDLAAAKGVVYGSLLGFVTWCILGMLWWLME